MSYESFSLGGALGVVQRKDIIFGERFRKDYGDIQELMESFKTDGIIQPLTVKDNKDGTYTLLAGGRRFTAATQLGIDEIPVRIYTKDLNDLEMRNIELMENVVRKDLNWAEAARLRTEILDIQKKLYGERKSTDPNAPGVSLRDVAEMLGKSPALLSVDQMLVASMAAFPDLEKQKTRTDALRMVDKMKEGMIKEEIAKRMQSKVSTSSIDSLRVALSKRYILSDCRAVLKGLPDNSVDFCEIDPPYAIDLINIKEGLKEKYDVNAYTEKTNEEYLAFMHSILKECYRVLTDNAWVVLWFGPQPWHEDMYRILVDVGFTTTRLNGIWYKGQQGQCMQPDLYLANSYESFYYARKGAPPIIRQGRSNVFHYKGVYHADKEVPTERPIEMIQDILSTFCWQGGRVFVPFLGSGNTILAADNLGMIAFGTDTGKSNLDSFTVRVFEGTPMQWHSYKKGADDGA